MTPTKRLPADGEGRVPTLEQVGKMIASCDAKTAFPTLSKALIAAKNLRERCSVRLNVYRCLICEEYHLTGSPGAISPGASSKEDHRWSGGKLKGRTA